MVYNVAAQIFIPAEGVYAIIEVKQDLSAQHIKYAGEKVESVRRLVRTSAPIPHAGGTYEPRVPHRIVGGLIAHHSSWSPAFGQALMDALHNLTANQQLDLGCALREGAFEVAYGGTGSPILSVYDGPRSLVQFLWRLLMRLQALATVPAIEFERYLSGI